MIAGSLQKLLDALMPFPESSCESIDLTGLASFAIHWLQERQIPTTFENIVVAAFKMFPAKFALEGYPQYPDAARVNRTLLQLRPKYRNWARGTVQKGFVLTESGLRKVVQVREILMAGAATERQSVGRQQATPRTMDLSRELESVKRSALFARWKEGKLSEGTPLQLLDMLGAYAYTPARALRDRLKMLEHAASQVGRNDLIQFFKNVRKSFDRQFRDS